MPRDTVARAARAARRRDVGRVGAGGRARPAPRDAGALRRVPQPGAPGRGRAQGDASSSSASLRTAIKDKSKTFNTARVEALELDNLIETAKATIVSAEARRESRGAQASSDYPNRDDVDWLKHSLWYRDGNRLAYKPVNMKPVSVEAFPPKTRTY